MASKVIKLGESYLNYEVVEFNGDIFINVDIPSQLMNAEEMLLASRVLYLMATELQRSKDTLDG